MHPHTHTHTHIHTYICTELHTRNTRIYNCPPPPTPTPTTSIHHVSAPTHSNTVPSNTTHHHTQLHHKHHTAKHPHPSSRCQQYGSSSGRFLIAPVNASSLCLPSGFKSRCLCRSNVLRWLGWCPARCATGVQISQEFSFLRSPDRVLRYLAIKINDK